jgi:hypothetical protein
MENYELYISAPPKRLHGYFPKGHKPFNKGIPMKEWMDGRKIKKVKKYLKLGWGNYNLPGLNRIKVVGIKDGILIAFNSATEAAKILKARGVKINKRNINSVCHHKVVINGKYSYVRKKAGGYQWFFAENILEYNNLLK